MKHAWSIGLVVLIALGGMAGLGWMILSDGSPGDSASGRTVAERGTGEDEPAPDLATGADETLQPSRVQTESGVAGDLAVAEQRTSKGVVQFVSGRVVNESGTPVANANVSVGGSLGFGGLDQILAAVGLGRERGVQMVKTDADGFFRLKDVSKEDNLQLRVDHPEYITVTRQRMYLPASGYDAGVVIMEKGAAVSGLVYGPDSRPLSGAEVAWHTTRGRGGRGGFGGLGAEILGEAVRSTTTDDGGKYRLAGLPPDAGKVRASHEGLAEATSEVEPSVGQESRGVALTLGPGIAFRGVVLDSDDLPVPKAQVTWRRSGFARGRTQEPEGLVETGADGQFSSPGLTPTAYDLTVQAPGYSTARVENVRPDEPDPIKVVLLPTGSLRCTVRDEVTGESVPGVLFTLQAGGQRGMGGVMNSVLGGGMFASGDVLPDQVMEGGDGSYELLKIGAGEWRLNVEATGYSPTRSDTVEVPSGGPSEVLEILMVPAVSVAGVVLDDEDSSPVAGARVRLQRVSDGSRIESLRGAFGGRGEGGGRGGRGEDGGRSGFDVGAMMSGIFGGGGTDGVTTDPEGRFLIEGVRPDSYTVQVEHPLFAPSKTTQIEVVPEEDLTDVEVRLVVGGSVEGVSLALDGSPAVGDTVVIRTVIPEGVEGRPQTVGRASTDAAGYYLVEHLEAGAYEARLEQRRDDGSGGFRGGRPRANEESDKPFVIEDQELVRVDFNQVEQPFLQGQVRSTNGAVADAEVRLSAQREGGGRGRGRSYTAMTDARGYYKITDLVPGNYTAEVKHPDSVVPLREDLVVEAGYGATHDFLLPGGVVSGIVRSSSGTPLSGAIVRLETAQASEVPGAETSAERGNSGAPSGNARGERTNQGAQDRGGRGGDRGDRGRGGFGGFGGSGEGVKTGADGSFTIEWVPEGIYRVVASHAQYIRARGTAFKMAENDRVGGQDLSMGEAGTLLVTVKDPETRRLVPQTMVQMQRTDGDGSEMRLTDADGVARFEGLAPGQWSVSTGFSFRGRGGRGGRGGDDQTGDQPAGTPVTVVAGREDRVEIYKVD